MKESDEAWLERLRKKADYMASFDTMADFTGAAVASVPASLTVGKVAGYVTGSGIVPWTATDFDKYPDKVRIRIDQSAGGAAFAAGTAQVLDIETGAATDADAVTSVPERQKRGEYSTIYVAAGNLAALQAKLKDAGVKMHKVGYWVANWDLDQSQAVATLGNEVVAVQWASPTENPTTLVPGTSLTLAQANVDLSVTLPGWYPPAAPAASWQARALAKANQINSDFTDLVALLKAHQ
ncbi:MAG: hypothetical protein ABSG46_20310 [Candidatus Binataceae bacterium]